jgi:hypothetical protein
MPREITAIDPQMPSWTRSRAAENGLYTADFNPVLRRSHQRLAVGLGPAPFQAK